MGENKKAQCILVLATPVADVARRWKNLLRESFVVHHATDFLQLVQAINEFKPSVVFFDLSLPRVNGTDRFSALLKLCSASKFILFAENPDEQEAAKALEAGAKGYAHRELDGVLLKKAVETVRKGELWVSRNTIPYLLKEITDLREDKNRDFANGLAGRLERRRKQFPSNRRLDLDRLTSREQEIAYLIGNGSSNKEIASLLKISESTVKAHLSAIYHKLGLLDRLSLALFVAEQMRNSNAGQRPVPRD